MLRTGVTLLRAPLRQAATASTGQASSSSVRLTATGALQRREWSSAATEQASLSQRGPDSLARPLNALRSPLGTRSFADKPPTSATEQAAKDKAQEDPAKGQSQEGSTSAAGEASESAFPTSAEAHPSGAQPPATAQSTRPSSRRAAFDVDTSELVTAAEEQADKRTTGARSRGSSPSSDERARSNTGRVLGLIFLIGAGFTISNLGREWDTVAEREQFGDDPLSQSFLGRLRLRVKSMYTSMQAPVWEKLLPDPLPFPYQRPYTLVLDVDDLLIHSEWSRAHAWRTAKRPGLDYFLGYLQQHFEIVVYTRMPIHIVAPVIEKLDPDMRLITYSIFRESCRTLDNGQVVKDLGMLNRDLSKVIAIDTDPEALQLNPENAIILNPWKGDPTDRDLLGLVSFLEAVAIYNIPDVRETLKSFAGTHIPTEHARRQAEVRAAEEEQHKQRQGKFGIGSLFGGIRGNSGGTTDASGKYKSWYDLERQRFQQAYMEEKKFWDENGEKLRQQAKEEQEKKLKEMKLNAWSFLTGQAMQQQQAPPADEPQPQIISQQPQAA